jgi:hypothetical protein
MKNIEITVMKKVAYADGMPTIVCGNNDYTLSFEFDDEWNDEQNKVARFSFVKNGLKSFIDVPIENNTCKVPVLLGIGLVRVGVYAGNLRTTTGAKIKCTKSILCDDAEEMAEPFENLYEEIKGSIADLEKATIQTINSPKIWELDAGVYRVSGVVSYGEFKSSAQTNSINLTKNVGILMVGLNPTPPNRRYFYLFANNRVCFGYSEAFEGLGETIVSGAISGEFSKVTKEISTASTPDEIPTAEAVVEYVNETIEGIESGGGSGVNVIDEVDIEGEYDGNDVPSMDALIGVVESLSELLGNCATKEQVEQTWTNCEENNKKLSQKFDECQNLLATKQDALVSGKNIKTINGESILGEGDLSVSGGSASGDKWTIVEQTFTYEGGESGWGGAFNLTPKTPSVSEFTEAYLWAKLSSTASGTHRINFCSDRVQIVPSQQISTTPTRLAVRVIKIGDTLYAQKVNDASVMATYNGFSDSNNLNLNTHWSTIGANEVITSVGVIMYR